MSNLQVQNMTSLAVYDCKICHKHPQWGAVCQSICCFEQRNETGFSADIPLKAIHSPIILCQHILVLEYTAFWALFPCRLSSKIMDKNERLCIHTYGSVGTRHTLFHVSHVHSIYKSTLFPYQSLGLGV